MTVWKDVGRCNSIVACHYTDIWWRPLTSPVMSMHNLRAVTFEQPSPCIILGQWPLTNNVHASSQDSHLWTTIFMHHLRTVTFDQPCSCIISGWWPLTNHVPASSQDSGFDQPCPCIILGQWPLTNHVHALS